MRKEYDFSKMKWRRNPYAKLLNKQVTIRLRGDVMHYFKTMADQMGMPYQTLINLYLLDCVAAHRKLKWAA